MKNVSVAFESRKKTKLLTSCFVLYELQGSEEPPNLCLYLQWKNSIPPQESSLKQDDWMSCSNQKVFSDLILSTKQCTICLQVQETHF